MRADSMPAPARPSGVYPAVLTLVLVTLFVIPSRLVFSPLGAAGSPTQMIGSVLFLVLMVRRFGSGVRTRVTPLHWALLAFAASVMAAYIVAATRPITAPELLSADRGVLAVVGWSGLFLAVADGLTTRADLDTFLRRMVVGVGFVAVVGLLQFVTKQQLTDHVWVPGLSDTTLLDLNDRSGFVRPDGTAIHPIEFGAVLTAVLPIALHFAMNDRGRTVFRRWWPVAAIAVAVPLSISRSAIISAAVILLVVVPTFSRANRRRTYAAVAGLGAFVYALVPGLLGTITGLFTGITDDGSAQSRTDSFALAEQFIHRYPVFGRGFGTLLINYRIFDDEYLGILVQMGVVGLAVTLGLLGTAIVSARRVRRASTDPATRSLAQALAASVASTAVSIAVYDAFGFSMDTNTLFLVLGATAALVRCSAHVSSRRQTSGAAGTPVRP